MAEEPLEDQVKHLGSVIIDIIKDQKALSEKLDNRTMWYDEHDIRSFPEVAKCHSISLKKLSEKMDKLEKRIEKLENEPRRVIYSGGEV